VPQWHPPEAELLGCGSVLAPCEHGVPTCDETSCEQYERRSDECEREVTRARVGHPGGSHHELAAGRRDGGLERQAGIERAPRVAVVHVWVTEQLGDAVLHDHAPVDVLGSDALRQLEGARVVEIAVGVRNRKAIDGERTIGTDITLRGQRDLDATIEGRALGGVDQAITIHVGGVAWAHILPANVDVLSVWLVGRMPAGLDGDGRLVPSDLDRRGPACARAVQGAKVGHVVALASENRRRENQCKRHDE
jgi:hypothetical protein